MSMFSPAIYSLKNNYGSLYDKYKYCFFNDQFSIRKIIIFTPNPLQQTRFESLQTAQKSDCRMAVACLFL